MTVLVLRADARDLPLPDQSVDLIVTSPPYWSQRDYRDGDESVIGQIGNENTPEEYVEALIECTREWARVLRPAGSIFVSIADTYYSAKGNPGPNGADAKQRARRGWVRPSDRSGLSVPRKSLFAIPARYEVACLDKLGLTFRRDIIWDKVNPTPDSTSDRCATRHEYLIHLVKRPRYYADSGGPLPGSVWRFPSQPLLVPAELGLDHPAAFPMELPRRCVLGWSPPGGLVADPFGGSGTTALVATVLGRHAVTCDLSAGYCRIAAWRTQDPGERARAMQVGKPPVVSHLQGTLFEVTA
jgi:DNA modification methylase